MKLPLFNLNLRVDPACLFSPFRSNPCREHFHETHHARELFALVGVVVELFDGHDFAVGQVQALVDHSKRPLPDVLAAPPLPAHDPMQVVVPALVGAAKVVVVVVIGLPALCRTIATGVRVSVHRQHWTCQRWWRRFSCLHWVCTLI